MPIDSASLDSHPGDLGTFAAVNGLRYEPDASPAGLGGAVFEFLQDARITDRLVADAVVVGPDAAGVAAAGSVVGWEVGNVHGTRGGGQSRRQGDWTVTTTVSTTSVRRFGYLALQLTRALPQLVLDGVANDSAIGSSLPMPIAADQRLSLEGDFDSRFRLFAPRGYERDALYVFTPDLMALLIDETGDFDVEVVDDRLYVYSTGGFDLTSRALWTRLDGIIRVIGAKALRQTRRYQDDRGETAGPGDAGAAAMGAGVTGAGAASAGGAEAGAGAAADVGAVGADGRRLRMSGIAPDAAATKRAVGFLVGGVVTVLIIAAVVTVVVVLALTNAFA